MHSNSNNPSSSQLSLWDIADMEAGFSHLFNLELDKAIHLLNKAISGPYNHELIQKALDTALYWQPRLEQKHWDHSIISDLLNDFLNFEFNPQIRKFREQLLYFIIDKMNEDPDTRKEKMIIAFDLLLEIKAYEKAEIFISNFMQQHPDDRHLLYLLAQTQWLSGNHSAAIQNDILALLYCPDDLPLERIESGSLKKIIIQYGAVMAPSYAWINDVAPFVLYNIDSASISEVHCNAIKYYQYLQQAQISLEKNEMKTCIQYRKLLKQNAPELYAAYYKRLQQKK